jgi:hypothetical protein
MVPREAGRGGNFLGAGKYYLHDRGATTSERVAFTHTENIPTQDPHKALKWQAWTAIHAEELKRDSGSKMTGRPCQKPVFTFSLSWHPDEPEPHKWEMIGAARRALIALGLQDHETVMVAHNDRDHPHLHLIVNVVHPETGRANRVPFSKKKLSIWAEGYERERGHIYCKKRVDNNAKRAQDQKVKYEEPELDLKAHITKLFHASDTGQAFKAALAEHGLTLAQGKRIVLIDRDGKIHSLSRQIEDVKAKDIRARLADLELPNVDEARGQIGAGGEEKKQKTAPEPDKKKRKAAAKDEQVYYDRDQQDREFQESIIDASIEADGAKESKPQPAQPISAIPSYLLNRLQDRHLAELGTFGTERTLARLKLAAELDQQYGTYERDLKQNIGQMEGVLKNSGRLRLWWLTVTGQVPKDAKQELENMRLSLADVETRQSYYRNSLEREMNERRQALEARHEQEKQRLRLAKTENPVSEDEQIAAVSHEQEIDEDFGPFLDY